MTERQTPLSDDELLCAYLDGELAGEDLARAERLLAEQPASRQLLAELRALGDALRALPRGQLGDGFPERVLRKAERQLLTESQVSDTRPADRSPADLRSARWRNKRPWIYAFASLAAGLIVAIISLPHPSAKQPASAGTARSASEAEGVAADKLASAPAAGAPTAAPSASVYPPAMAASKPAAGAKRAERLAISPARPERAIALKTALAQWGFAPLDADEIVQQLNVSEQQAAAAQPLNVWSISVDADALEHDRLGRVLTQNRVQVLEQRPLNRGAATTAKAANAAPPAASSSASHAPVMAVLVAGSPDQLQSTLADLRSQSSTFQRLTDLGRKSLPADSSDRARPQTAPGSKATEAGAGDERKDKAQAEKTPSSRGLSKSEAQGPTEWALFILRRAEPVSPAEAKAVGKKSEPAPVKPKQDDE